MQAERDAEGKIMKGFSLNPNGRPKGAVSGRSRALALVDEVLGVEENVKSLEAALSKALREKPLWFFVNIVMPLLPKETKGVLDGGDRIVEWRGLVTTGAGSSLGHAIPARGAAVCALPGDAGDAGFVHVREVAPAAAALPVDPETPPF